jgi:hypothetical protein
MLEARKLEEVSTDKKAVSLGARTLAEKVRVKDPELRTLDDKRFLGMDLIRAPHFYEHLSSTEIEEMHYDVNYQCTLSLPDLERIEKLPDQVALALPFLYTSEEIQIHRLMNKYLRGKDDDYFRNRDRNNYTPVDINDNEGAVNIDDLQVAEVVHDILVKVSSHYAYINLF